MTGVVYGDGRRFVVPLRVGISRQRKDVVVFFIVDSGAPNTLFGENTLKRLFGESQPPPHVTIQG